MLTTRKTNLVAACLRLKDRLAVCLIVCSAVQVSRKGGVEHCTGTGLSVVLIR